MIKRVLIAAIVPLLWLVFAAVTEGAMGRYSPFDPDYYYLLSALDLAESKSIGMYHHPGTPAEVMGAAVIHLAQFVSPAAEGMQQAVLRNPEQYLAWFHIASALLIAAGLGGAGLILLSVTGNPTLAVLLQASVFMVPVVAVDSASRFKAEPFLLLASLGVLATTAVVVRGTSSRWWPAIAFAAFCGFGLATKLTFVSVLLLPVFLLRGLARKGVFAIGAVLAMAVFTLPIADRYPRLWAWTYTVSSHTGIYGDGAPGIVDVTSYRQGFAALFARNLVYDVVVIAGLLVITVGLITSWRRPCRPEQRADLAALCAVVIAQTAGFVLAAKYGSYPEADRYLFGPACLLGLTVWLTFRVLAGLDWAAPRVLGRAAAGTVLLAVLVCLAITPKEVAAHIRLIDGARRSFTERDARLESLLANVDRGSARIFDMSFRNSIFGLLQATFYSTEQLDGLVLAYPGVYFCETSCTPENWTTARLMGVDHSKRFTLAEALQAHEGRAVLISGTAPTVHVEPGPRP